MYLSVYTDGACSGNPGGGGWAYILEIYSLFMRNGIDTNLFLWKKIDYLIYKNKLIAKVMKCYFNLFPDEMLLNEHLSGACSLYWSKDDEFLQIINNCDVLCIKSLAYCGNMPITTNNKMELLAVIYSLFHILCINGTLKVNDVFIFSDSKYVIQGITTWIMSWKNNGWLNSDKQRIKNLELWLIFYELSVMLKDSIVNIHWNWVKGHDKNVKLNAADAIAVNMSKKKS